MIFPLIYIVVNFSLVLSFEQHRKSLNNRVYSCTSTLVSLNRTNLSVALSLIKHRPVAICGLLTLLGMNVQHCLCKDPTKNAKEEGKEALNQILEQEIKKDVKPKKEEEDKNTFLVVKHAATATVMSIISFILSNQYFINRFEPDFYLKLHAIYNAYKNKKPGDVKNANPSDKDPNKALTSIPNATIPVIAHNDRRVGPGCFKDGQFDCDMPEHKEKIFGMILSGNTDELINVLSLEDPILEELILRNKMLTVKENNAIIEFINLLKEKKPVDFSKELKGKDTNDYELLYPQFKASISLALYFVNTIWDKATAYINKE